MDWKSARERVSTMALVTRFGRVGPGRLAFDQVVLAEVVAVGQRVEHGFRAVLAGADLVDLAVRDQVHRVGRLALGGDARRRGCTRAG